MASSGSDPAAELAVRYDHQAAAYRDCMAVTLHGAGARLLEELGDHRAERVLDVGAGVGTLLPDLRELFPGACVVGVDRSPGMLALAPAEFPRAVMDGGRLAVADAGFDLVTAFFMLFHLAEPFDGLREARRVLRARGRVAALTWAGELESHATLTWEACLDELGAPDPPRLSRHDSLDTPQKLEALLSAAGFARARAWREDVHRQTDLESLIRHKTSLGGCKPRYDGLDEAGRMACVEEARRRMADFDSTDFLESGPIVAAIGAV